MRIGYLQFSPVFGKKDHNLERVREFLSGAKADLIVLPELFATGYIFESREEVLGLAETADGPTFSCLKRISQEMALTLVAGIAEREGSACYNSCFLFSEGQIKASYRKVHLFDMEKEWFTPGNGPFVVADLGSARLGLMICFDWIFPETARALAIKGAQIICHPANLILPHCPQAMITRCLENRVFAITANRIGFEARSGQELKFIGKSQVISPRGEVLIRAGEDEVLQVVEISPAMADDKMVTPRNDIILDRKPELYGDICGRGNPHESAISDISDDSTAVTPT